MNAILQALFALVPFSTDLLNVADKLEADGAENNQWSVSLLLIGGQSDDQSNGQLVCYWSVVNPTTSPVVS